MKPKYVRQNQEWLDLIEQVFFDHIERDRGKHETGVYLLTTKTEEHWILMPRWHPDRDHPRGGNWTKGLYCVDDEFQEDT